MIDWRRAQSRLGVKQDGDFGPVSYGALLSTVANADAPLAIDFGRVLAANDDAYGLTENADRLASFVGQCCHESAGFTRLHEVGGPRYFTKLYEGRADLGNTQPGDGARFHGRGLIQLTGRANYRRYGMALGADFLVNPDLVATPNWAVMTALEYWKRNDLNALADRQDWNGQTRRINGGQNGIRERVALITLAKGLLE